MKVQESIKSKVLSLEEEQAMHFAGKYDLSMKILAMREGKYFHGDTDIRDIYTIQLKRGDQVYTFDFGASLDDREKRLTAKTWKELIYKEWIPSLYTVLSCMTKYDVGDYIDFCESFGYEHSRTTLKIYKSVVLEYESICRLFPEPEAIEELQQIQ